MPHARVHTWARQSIQIVVVFTLHPANLDSIEITRFVISLAHGSGSARRFMWPGYETRCARSAQLRCGLPLEGRLNASNITALKDSSIKSDAMIAGTLLRRGFCSAAISSSLKDAAPDANSALTGSPERIGVEPMNIHAERGSLRVMPNGTVHRRTQAGVLCCHNEQCCVKLCNKYVLK
jgi:hypothetical protein